MRTPGRGDRGGIGWGVDGAHSAAGPRLPHGELDAAGSVLGTVGRA